MAGLLDPPPPSQSHYNVLYCCIKNAACGFLRFGSLSLTLSLSDLCRGRPAQPQPCFQIPVGKACQYFYMQRLTRLCAKLGPYPSSCRFPAWLQFIMWCNRSNRKQATLTQLKRCVSWYRSGGHHPVRYWTFSVVCKLGQEPNFDETPKSNSEHSTIYLWI